MTFTNASLKSLLLGSSFWVGGFLSLPTYAGEEDTHGLSQASMDLLDLVSRQSSVEVSSGACGWGGSYKPKCELEPIQLSTGQSLSIVARVKAPTGGFLEYRKDTVSGLLWSPPSQYDKIYVNAKAYCESKDDLGRKWRLPTRKEFLQAGNQDNLDRNDSSNKPFAQAMGMKGDYFTSTSYAANTQWAFVGDEGQVQNFGDRRASGNDKFVARAYCVSE